MGLVVRDGIYYATGLAAAAIVVGWLLPAHQLERKIR